MCVWFLLVRAPQVQDACPQILSQFWQVRTQKSLIAPELRTSVLHAPLTSRQSHKDGLYKLYQVASR
jgi:hypothetical protein